jgi:hypothetical protein
VVRLVHTVFRSSVEIESCRTIEMTPFFNLVSKILNMVSFNVNIFLFLASIVIIICLAVKAKNVVTLSVNKIFAQPGIGEIIKIISPFFSLMYYLMSIHQQLSALLSY